MRVRGARADGMHHVRADSVPSMHAADLRSSSRTALAVLTGINLLNYLDRYIVAGMVGPLKAEFDASDTEIGLLMSVFLVSYMVVSPAIGWVARTRSRTGLLALGVALWSAATAGGAFARSIWQLLLMRAATGVGEAAYATVGPALLADHYPPERRSAALSVFYAAIPVGTACGYMLAGFISSRWGWREAFLVAGLPGLAIALLCLWLRDPPRGRYDAPQHPGDGAVRLLPAAAALARNRRFVQTTIGYAAFTFAFGALATWMPYYMEQVRGWSADTAAVAFGGIIVGTGFAGTLLGGWAATRLGRGRDASALRIAGWCMLAATPLSIVALAAPQPWVLVPALVLAATLSFATQGPINAVTLNSVGPSMRAAAVGVSVLCIHLFGDVPSPALAGWISDHAPSSWRAAALEVIGSGADSGLPLGLAMIPVAMAIAGAVWLREASQATPTTGTLSNPAR
jgi:MFS family permease